MTNVLRPFGRDKQNVVIDGSVALISCLERTTWEDDFESQPVAFAERFLLVFDGRLDNRDDLRRLLNITLGGFDRLSDSALLARLIAKEGEAGFARLAGVYAAILLDRVSGELLCARDHMGMRALHYHWDGHHFAVATVPDALFALSWVTKEIDLNKVGDLLVQRGLNGETTYFKGVQRVLPAHIVRISAKGLSKSCYWSIDSTPAVRFRRDGDYVDAFSEIFQKAVVANLRSRTVPCASLSGGLDSSSVAVAAADVLGGQKKYLRTFTAVPEAGFSKPPIRGRHFNERPFVEGLAALNPFLQPEFVEPSEGDLVEKIKRQIAVAGAPVGGVLNGIWNIDILERARSQGFKVMLSGEMGNHTFSYSGWARLPRLARNGELVALLGEIVGTGYRWKYMLRHVTLAALAPRGLFASYKRWRRGGKDPWFSYAAIRSDFAFESGIVARASAEYLPFDARPPTDGRQHRIDTMNSFSETADWFARLRCAFGVDIRTPAFDRRVVEYCLNIPDDQYFRQGVDRLLIRRAMVGRLPPAVLDNQSYGVQAADWFSMMTRNLPGISQEIARFADDPTVSAIIDVKRLEEIVRNWPGREPPEFGESSFPMLWALPQAFGAAEFIRLHESRN